MTPHRLARWVAGGVASAMVWLTAGCQTYHESTPPVVSLWTINRDDESAAPSPVVGTYNLHWLKDTSGLRNDLSRLDHVSIWAFQEVRGWSDGSLPARLVDVLPPGRWHVAWMPLNPLRELNSTDWEGQAVVSRYPIRLIEAWELQPEGKRRFALAAYVEIGGADVLVVSTDHQPSLFSLRRENIRQAQQLTTYLADHGSKPAIVTGDFNTAGCIPRLVSSRQDRQELRRLMSDAGFTPASSDVHATFKSGLYDAVLDHIFVRGLKHTASNVHDAATGSDHRPVWCRLDLNVTAASSTLQSVAPGGP
jgi:endonuclease/exonuclease/phosphatase family metal-dependent hydrolase